MTDTFSWPSGSYIDVPVKVPSDTPCLAFMDSTVIGDVWEDFLFDGHGHDHAEGGLMLLPGAFGTHFSWPTEFPVTVVYNPAGFVEGFEINIDPLNDEIPHHGFNNDDFYTGWTREIYVTVPSGVGVLGDPVGLPEVEGTGGLITLDFPADEGELAVSVYSENGVRKLLRARWVD